MRLDKRTQRKLEKQLQEVRAKIPEALDTAITSFNWQQSSVAHSLISAANRFQDPEEGFRLWQDYYHSGDEVSLKHALAETPSATSLTLSIRELVGDFQRAALQSGQTIEELVGLNMELVRADSAVRKTVALKAFDILGMSHLIPEEDRDPPKEPLEDSWFEPVKFTITLNDFRVARWLVFFPGLKQEPLLEALQPHLQKIFDEHLTTSLDTLNAFGYQPLLATEFIESFKPQILDALTKRFDHAAEQLLSPASDPTRATLNLASAPAPSGLRFGVELEGFIPGDEQTSVTAEMLQQKMVECGLPANPAPQPPKADSVYDKWSVTNDMSVVNPLRYPGWVWSGQGELELVSPILEGEEGLAQVQAMVALLQEEGFVTNDSCALHLHVDMEQVPLEGRKNLATAFVRNEPAIDAFIDSTRRGNDNGYASSVAHVSPEAIDASSTTSELVNVVNGGDRHSKFSLTNLDFPGAKPTVEFRGEGGAGYLDSAVAYTTLMLNFTAHALTNPDITLDEVLESLKPKKSFTADVKTRRAAPPETAATR